eukprot:GHVN01076332.1.p1 GENE.GHVN01076332.1~~GHVN01076332.1.p1  ORF type:complete len:158 (+),score=16.78 GHVN01076332.1:235-708(+)
MAPSVRYVDPQIDDADTVDVFALSLGQKSLFDCARSAVMFYFDNCLFCDDMWEQWDDWSDEDKFPEYEMIQFWKVNWEKCGEELMASHWWVTGDLKCREDPGVCVIPSYYFFEVGCTTAAIKRTNVTELRRVLDTMTLPHSIGGGAQDICRDTRPWR